MKKMCNWQTENIMLYKMKKGMKRHYFPYHKIKSICKSAYSAKLTNVYTLHPLWAVFGSGTMALATGWHWHPGIYVY